MQTADRPRAFLPILVGLVALAWLSLALWGQSPWSRYLDHHALADISVGRDGLLLLVFVAGWTLLTAGVCQFSALKHRCLDAGRSPLTVIGRHCRGRDERRESAGA
jgi:predicted metal-binding membrane protein